MTPPEPKLGTLTLTTDGECMSGFLTDERGESHDLFGPSKYFGLNVERAVDELVFRTQCVNGIENFLPDGSVNPTADPALKPRLQRIADLLRPRIDLHASAVEPERFAADRSFVVPAGQTVRTGYVSVFDIEPECRDRMAVGDVASAFQKVLQRGDTSSFPCPNGHWHLNTFLLQDGRHEWLASIMAGKTHILVAWLE